MFAQYVLHLLEVEKEKVKNNKPKMVSCILHYLVSKAQHSSVSQHRAQGTLSSARYSQECAVRCVLCD